MNKLTHYACVTAATLSSQLLAGETTLSNLTPENEQRNIIVDDKKWAQKPSKLLDFSLESRVRYEFREQGNLDASHAGTVRLRPGFTILPDAAFSAFIQGEFTAALLEDYQVGTPQSSNLEPFTAGNTPILDPETEEINQLYGQYKKDGLKIRVGRQRYVLDNAAFVGNLIWRQNEQTYDAATIAYETEDYSLSYAYSNQVNRIFGSDAEGLVKELEGDIHLFNGWKKFNDVKLGGYAYLLDFDEGSKNAFTNRASSNTYGAYLEYQGLHAEFAIQTDSEGSTLNRNQSFYAHVYYGTEIGDFQIKGGLEHLGEDFYTPLSTVHLFNGFADNFIGSRIGLADSPGINDLYITATTKVSDVTLKGFAHYFTDDSVSKDFGWELDLIAHKPLAEGLNLVTKLAYYHGGTTSDDEIKQASVQLDYNF